MEVAVLFKVLQRKYKFRNPFSLLSLPEDFIYSPEEYSEAEEYLKSLGQQNINYCYPGHIHYPKAFFRMKEPPLFFEYLGEPLWENGQFISVVGSREVAGITEQWLKSQLESFILALNLGIVSGGARGVDQLAHLIAIKNRKPTLFVLPSGLLHLYPRSLKDLRLRYRNYEICFISEFETNQELNKSHFYFRNRLIAALGQMTLVAQASLKSGSLLTVHHCLEMGKPVITIPAHPEMHGFDGNLKLIQEGAYSVRNAEDLRDFWQAESWPN